MSSLALAGNLPHACGDEPEKFLTWLRAAGDLPHACGDEPAAIQMQSMTKHICPTHVGMNRVGLPVLQVRLAICPTHVGMNRRPTSRSWRDDHLPHACGDELALNAKAVVIGVSALHIRALRKALRR